MLYEYNLNNTTNSNANSFYLIGAIMLLGGIIKLVSEINSEGENAFPRVLLYIVTSLGGLGFLIMANKSKDAHKNTARYSIQINDEKIITKHGNDSKIKEVLLSEISKIDFNSKDIHVYGKNDNKIVVDLALISPEEKKNELRATLKKIGKIK